MTRTRSLAAVLLLCAAQILFAAEQKVEILNFSYDVSRELFAQINPAFQAVWLRKNGHPVEVREIRPTGKRAPRRLHGIR